MNEQQPQIIIKESTQVYGLLSVIFGFVGIFILSFLLSPLAFILGIISFSKKEYLPGMIGIIFAILGALTSPVLMALFGMTTVTYFGDVIVL
ncbi:MAG: hypothetical protein VX864_01025 [Pseudomonadota bacterium]|nr:hypothetical protein [Pseudomonadota bacterium]MEC8996184.1 hypothetical protein [Pseudomonadota bacterium]MED5429965.1 hypothetical protein [Pseudomonadota bacterium]|tara:strand:- start:339 stop:614 length:276 start_codon:yes stop_codon:yes gene_type:complete